MEGCIKEPQFQVFFSRGDDFSKGGKWEVKLCKASGRYVVYM